MFGFASGIVYPKAWIPLLCIFDPFDLANAQSEHVSARRQADPLRRPSSVIFRQDDVPPLFMGDIISDALWGVTISQTRNTRNEPFLM